MTSDPFSFPGMKIIKDRQESSKLNVTDSHKVIIAGSGMMTGGRILDHAKFFLPISSTRLLMVGYQGTGTLGRQLLDGEKNVKIDKQTFHVESHVSETQVMSSHADQPRLITWLGSIQGIKRVIITHGEDTPREVLAEKIKTALKITEITLPVLNQELEL